MSIQEKLTALDHIYRVYDDFIGEHDTACRKGCHRCCTRNVTLTTLEAYKITAHLHQTDGGATLKTLSEIGNMPRFIPRVTTNGLADICMRGEDPPPEEEIDPDWGPCPLLDGGQCPLYVVRPYGCRCMVSTKRCEAGGFAEMAPFILTVNNVFLQYIEHIDRDGFSGNLTDTLRFMASETNRRRYREGAIDHPPEGMIRNHAVRALMVPPRHRQRLAPILKALDPRNA